jgi:hypothetical protein
MKNFGTRGAVKKSLTVLGEWRGIGSLCAGGAKYNG